MDGGLLMGSIDEQILRAAKEIVVKFIETGRVSPASFQDTFQSIYNTVEKAAKGKVADEDTGGEGEPPS
jgi:hypothetical protein